MIHIVVAVSFEVEHISIRRGTSPSWMWNSVNNISWYTYSLTPYLILIVRYGSADDKENHGLQLV